MWVWRCFPRSCCCHNSWTHEWRVRLAHIWCDSTVEIDNPHIKGMKMVMDRKERTPKQREDAQDTYAEYQCCMIPSVNRFHRYWCDNILVCAHSFPTLALIVLSSGCQNPTRVSPLNSPLNQTVKLLRHWPSVLGVAVWPESRLPCVDDSAIIGMLDLI